MTPCVPIPCPRCSPGLSQSAWIAVMAQGNPASPRPPASAAPPGGLPSVRVEVRLGTPRTTTFDVGESSFLVGTVAGCDLRLPGTDLPPVICLIARHASGASFRKLVATQSILLNGKPASSGPLRHGDLLSIGVAELTVRIATIIPASVPPTPVGPYLVPVEQPSEPAPRSRRADPPEREAELRARADELNRQKQELDSSRKELSDIR